MADVLIVWERFRRVSLLLNNFRNSIGAIGIPSDVRSWEPNRCWSNKGRLLKETVTFPVIWLREAENELMDGLARYSRLNKSVTGSCM